MSNIEIAADGFIAMALQAGHKILFQTVLPAPGSWWCDSGKEYVWMKDVDGTIYLERIVKNEVPVGTSHGPFEVPNA